MEKKHVVLFDPNSSGSEDGSAVMVTKESNGDQGSRGKLWKNMGFTSCVRQKWNMQSGSVAGLQVAAIREKDQNYLDLLASCCCKGQCW